MTLTMGSLFSGIGGFDLGFERAGIETRWMCEIDKNARAVLKRHWPNVPIIEDVRNVTTGNTEPVNIICGGFPCQDLSVAGKRAGLAGERSGLFYEFIRIVNDLRPMWVVVENVPGLLSSNNGKDIQIVIDSFTQIGYTVDIDIKDAQEFGVSQRRRRVFLTCVKLDGLLQQRTNLSRQISADLLAQILLNTWAAIPQASSLVQLHWDYEKPIERSVNFLRKMTGLLETTLERLVSKKYQNGLSALLDQFGAEDKDWACGSVERTEIHRGERSKEMDTLLSELIAESGEQNISSWLNKFSVDVYLQAKPSTTLTSTSQITDLKIFIFAVMGLHIIGRILRSLDWSVNCWSVAQSVLTLLQENMNYAREASRYLFIESGLRDGWRDYLSSASGIQGEIERHIGAIRAAEVLFERESLPGDTPPRREKGEGTAGNVEVSPALRSEGHDASEDGRGRRALIGFAHTSTVDPQDNLSPAITLSSGLEIPSPPMVAFGGNNTSSDIDVSTRHGGSEPSHHNAFRKPAISGVFGVRRLTPVECERLQGFPDVTKSAIISVCTDHLKTSASAGSQNPRLPKRAGTAGKKDLLETVKSAESSLSTSDPQTSEPVAVHVQIDLERQVLLVHSHEKLLLSVSIAERKSSSPLRMPAADFARLVALTLTTRGKTTHNGKAVSRQNTMPSTAQPSGNNVVRLYGEEIGTLVADAEEFTKMVNICLTYTTSEAAQSSLNLEQISTISSYCVVTAIASFIPELINPTSSYNLKLSASGGWTAGQADSARYRQLGNAVAVPVVEWIARRIVEATA